MMKLIRPVITAIFSDWRMSTGIAASISLNLSIGAAVNQWLRVIISAMTIINLAIKIRNAWRGANADSHV